MELQKCEVTGVDYNPRFLTLTKDGHKVATTLYNKVGIDRMTFDLSLNDITTTLDSFKQHFELVRAFVCWCKENSAKSDNIAFNEIILESEQHKARTIEKWKKDLFTITRQEHMLLLQGYNPKSLDYANHNQGQEDIRKYLRDFQHMNKLHINKRD